MKQLALLSLIGTLSFFLSCDTFEDCLLFSAKAKFNNEEIPVGKVGEAYSGTIEGDIKNDFDEGLIAYSFEIAGLPEGLSFTEDNNLAIIEGTPEVAGSFILVVSLTVQDNCFDEEEDEVDCDNICGGSHTETTRFTLDIAV